MNPIWKPNVTVAALIERAGRFLLVEEETEDGLRFNQPAGHLDHGESLVAACARETLEETAWGFRPTALVGIYLWPRARPAGGRTPGRAGGAFEQREQPLAASARQRQGFAEHRGAPLPAGRGEPAAAAAARGRPPDDVSYLRFAFCGELGAHEAGRALDAGIQRALWMTPDEIRASTERHRSPLVWQCVSDYLAGRRFPLELVRHYD